MEDTVSLDAERGSEVRIDHPPGKGSRGSEASAYVPGVVGQSAARIPDLEMVDRRSLSETTEARRRKLALATV